jgi:hypothetical protein
MTASDPESRRVSLGHSSSIALAIAKSLAGWLSSFLRQSRPLFGSRKAWRQFSSVIPMAAYAACVLKVPPIEDPRSLPPGRIEVRSGRVVVSSPTSEAPALVQVEARSFTDWNDLVAFAERQLGAKGVYGPDGRVLAIQGDFEQVGEIVYRDADGSVFAEEFVPAYLGGATGRVRVGEEVLDLQRIDPKGSIVLFARREENCIESDCVSGETWLTHRIIYHSVGGKTRQTSGGTRAVSYQCCSVGQLATVDGRRLCRRLKPGAWEYDRELGRLVPTSENAYLFSKPRTCSRQARSNRLRVDLRLIFGPTDFTTLSAEEDNTREVQIKRWLISAGGDIIGTQFLDDVIGVCGVHSSTRGGNVRTSDGFTGDNDILCQG